MSNLISVIVPVYKVEDYIRRCVDSIINQSYKNLEIILIDDGSPDKCGEICDQYSIIDSRVKVIHKKNGGLSDARNVGIDLSKGDYITFIDSDDWVSENYISTLFNLIISYSADISVCDFIKTSNELNNMLNFKKSIYEFTNIQAIENLSGKFYEQLTVSWGKLYSSKLFVGIRFPIGKIHEDEFLTYRLLYRAHKIIVTTEKLLYYWQRNESITGMGFKLNNRLHALEAFEERADFFYKNDQLELRDKTLKMLFSIYRSINDNINMFNDLESKKMYVINFNHYKSKLRYSKQTLAFKFYYEIYFISPKIANIILAIYKRLYRKV